MVVACKVRRSRSKSVCVTPFLNSCRPVISAERVGAQVGLTWKFVKRTLASCNRSSCGVWMIGLPWRPSSPYP